MDNIHYSCLKCFCNFLKSCEFMMIGLMEESRENLALTFLYIDIVGAVIGTKDKIQNRSIFLNLFSDCVIFPGWWLLSIMKDFPELWETNPSTLPTFASMPRDSTNHK